MQPRTRGRRLGDDDAAGAGWLDDEVSEAALKMDFKESAIQAAARGESFDLEATAAGSNTTIKGVER